MLTFNNGYKTCNAFFPAVQDLDANKMWHASTSSKDKETDKETEEIVNFTETLRVAMNPSKGYTVLDVFMKHHERLNHQPLSVMHLLSE